MTPQAYPSDDDPPPVPPLSPVADDCCQSGCDRCVYVVYDEALERYHVALGECQERRDGQTSGERS